MLDRIEQIARIISRFIIPAVIAPVALIISSDIKKHDISMNYMELAMDVLRLPQDSDHNSELRKWALDIFTKYSPVPLDENLQKKIRGGEITLPPDLDKVSDIGSGRYVEVPLSSFISVVVASKQVTKQEIDRFVITPIHFFQQKKTTRPKSNIIRKNTIIDGKSKLRKEARYKSSGLTTRKNFRQPGMACQMF